MIRPKCITIYPSYTLYGDHTVPQAGLAHYVIENGWREWGKGWEYRHDGEISQVREEHHSPGSFPEMLLNSMSLSVCLVGVPYHLPPAGALEAGQQYFERYSPWVTERQIRALIELLASLCSRFHISPMTKTPLIHEVQTRSDPRYRQSMIPTIWQRKTAGTPHKAECLLNLQLIREEVAHRLALN